MPGTSSGSSAKPSDASRIAGARSSSRPFVPYFSRASSKRLLLSSEDWHYAGSGNGFVTRELSEHFSHLEVILLEGLQKLRNRSVSVSIEVSNEVFVFDWQLWQVNSDWFRLARHCLICR